MAEGQRLDGAVNARLAEEARNGKLRPSAAQVEWLETAARLLRALHDAQATAGRAAILFLEVTDEVAPTMARYKADRMKELRAAAKRAQDAEGAYIAHCMKEAA